MLLTVDVGNTHTVMGLYNGSTLIASWRFPTLPSATEDELCMALYTLMRIKNLEPSEISNGVLSCVVPPLTPIWCKAIFNLSGAQTLLCSVETAGSLFTSHYPHPEEVGADRVADVVACKALYGFPSIVVDFGTATNMEVIDKHGFFIGGIIAPGVQTSASTLFSHGAQLSAIDLEPPAQVIGTNTKQALESGIMFGEAARVDGLIRKVWEELGYETNVIATGGLASQVAQLSTLLNTVNENLTLEGLRLLAESHAK